MMRTQAQVSVVWGREANTVVHNKLPSILISLTESAGK